MIKADDFTARVNYAAKCITKMSIGGRAFDSCFEMCDGDAVVVALYRRSLKNPKLAANLWKAICQTSTMQAVSTVEAVPTRKLSEVARKMRSGEWYGAPETHTATCDACGREFVDESAELAADMLEAHKAIAHKPAHECYMGDGYCSECEPDAAPYVPDEYADTSARVIQFPARAEFRRSTPDDLPEPTGTDGGGSVEPGADRSSGGQSEQVAGASEPPACAHAETRVEPRPSQTTEGLIQFEQCVSCNAFWEVAPRSALPPWPVKGTVTRETLRALKLINDAAVLEEKRRATEEAARDGYTARSSAIFSDSLVRVRAGEVEAIINVAKLDKWAATFEAGDLFTAELTTEGLTLTRGSSYFRMVRPAGLPSNLTPIDLKLSESGEWSAPALPSAAEMKAARKELAEGRKALRAERARQNALRGVHSASADVKRAEEWAAKLEDETRETIQRAEELSESECDEAVTLAKRVRDLRRLHRAVEQAAEDPQVNTPEFFEWLSDEHRAAYAESYPELERAERRSWHKKASTIRARLRVILRRAFESHVSGEVAELAAAECEEYGPGAGFTTIFGRRFDTEVQTIKRTLRRSPGRIAEARERVAKCREAHREALEAYGPHVLPEEHDAYVRLIGGFISEAARAA